MATLAAVASHSLHGDGQRGNHAYTRRRPEEGVLYGVVQAELESFVDRAQARERPVPRLVGREPRGFLRGYVGRIIVAEVGVEWNGHFW